MRLQDVLSRVPWELKKETLDVTASHGSHENYLVFMFCFQLAVLNNDLCLRPGSEMVPDWFYMILLLLSIIQLSGGRLVLNVM